MEYDIVTIDSATDIIGSQILWSTLGQAKQSEFSGNSYPILEERLPQSRKDLEYK